LGYIFPDFGVETLPTIAEVICESKLRKMVLKPIGLVLPEAGTETDLMIASFETLTSELVEADQLVVPGVDANGETQTYEPRPTLEPQQPAPTRPLKTEVLKGSATLTPINWTPAYQRPLVVDFGFLPDNGRADFLAQKIAVREQRRRDQVLADMPIPDEWLSAGWPLLSRCQIGGDVYLMDGCAISISDGEAKFGFTGAMISRSVSGVSTALYSIDVDIEPVIILDCDLSVSIGADALAIVRFEMVLGSGIVVEIGVDVEFESTISSSGGEAIDLEISFESIVSSSGGALVDAPITLDAIVTVVTTQTVNITVTPSVLNEGTPAIQTINITVTPATLSEGT
jgi:hypothetical protein